jgi:hypothetical protein
VSNEETIGQMITEVHHNLQKAWSVCEKIRAHGVDCGFVLIGDNSIDATSNYQDWVKSFRPYLECCDVTGPARDID